MEQGQSPKQVQPEDTETIQIEERDAQRKFNIISTPLLWIAPTLHRGQQKNKAKRHECTLQCTQWSNNSTIESCTI